MSREDDFAVRMRADAPLTAILTGGIYTASQVGSLGISRGSEDTDDENYSVTAAAFDENGWLLPCALVRQRAEIPDGYVFDPIEKIESVSQVVEIWLYQDTGYAALDAARARLFTLFTGHQFADTGEIRRVGEIDRQVDTGALKDASLARMDFAVYWVREG